MESPNPTTQAANFDAVTVKIEVTSDSSSNTSQNMPNEVQNPEVTSPNDLDILLNPEDYEVICLDAAPHFFCRFCDRRFFTKQALGGHQNAHRIERALERAQRDQEAAAAPLPMIDDGFMNPIQQAPLLMIDDLLLNPNQQAPLPMIDDMLVNPNQQQQAPLLMIDDLLLNPNQQAHLLMIDDMLVNPNQQQQAPLLMIDDLLLNPNQQAPLPMIDDMLVNPNQQQQAPLPMIDDEFVNPNQQAPLPMIDDMNPNHAPLPLMNKDQLQFGPYAGGPYHHPHQIQGLNNMVPRPGFAFNNNADGVNHRPMLGFSNFAAMNPPFAGNNMYGLVPKGRGPFLMARGDGGVTFGGGVPNVNPNCGVPRTTGGGDGAGGEENNANAAEGEAAKPEADRGSGLDHN